MIRVLPDLDALGRAAAELFARQARLAISRRQRFAVALSGGQTPRGLYELLAAPPWRDAIDWQKIHVFWGDERCVPPDDPRSNARMARAALLDHVPVPPDQIHPILCHQNPARSAERYRDLLRDFFGNTPPVFDLILLGLGEDGHTASLFPQAQILHDSTAWTASVYVEAQAMHRVTLMPALINQARLVVFLVSGAAKAAILKAVLSEPADPVRWPAQLIRPGSNELVWLADMAAAAQLDLP
ncbi:MAG: 6-phosphogluconolactonase [Desulfobacteraceae bacterium]|nr:6-phosphogluconolactonase [Desulfobacteraceae bacterium]